MSENDETPHVEARAGLASAAGGVPPMGEPEPEGNGENGDELGGEG
jgi:hypothetical protein